MKSYSKILILVLSSLCVNAQQSRLDSLSKALKNANSDIIKYQVYTELYYFYEETNRDSALYFAEKGLVLATKNRQQLAFSSALSNKGYQLTQKGSYAEALQCLFKAVTIAGDPQNEKNSWPLSINNTFTKERLSLLARTEQFIGYLMALTQNNEQALVHLKETKRIAFLNDEIHRVGTADMVIGRVYTQMNKLDSALIFLNSSEKIKLEENRKFQLSTGYWYQGNIYFLKNNVVLAKQFYYKGVNSALEQKNLSGLARNYFALTKLFLSLNEKDSSLYYANKSLETINTLKASAQSEIDLGIAYQNLYLSYLQRNQMDSAFKYQSMALVTKDSLYKSIINSLTEFQNLTFREQLRLKELEKEKETFQNQLIQYALLTGLGVFLLIAFFLYRNNQKEKKAKNLLQEKNEEIQSTLSKLKSTQAQLIQSEKLASLGELTAGIAHEIQNPLNFVNNFSEMSVELAQELKDEIKKPEKDWELIEDLAEDLSQNQSKINHHGKRASSIVSGMLEHSKASTGERALTDINKLADEYLRLSYHGIRAKDSSFNSDYQTEFDENLPKIEVIPQDMGRVLLNLINNAFWAVKTVEKPLVMVKTEQNENQLIIKVIDNGTGMTDEVKAKIFQPFFTTKPTGQGTGLGLSLAYDIVTKGHGGTLEVESVEGEETMFTVKLPIKIY